MSFDVHLSTSLLCSVIGDISFVSCLQLYLWVCFLCTDSHFAICFFSGDHLWLKFEYTLTCIWQKKSSTRTTTWLVLEFIWQLK